MPILPIIFLAALVCVETFAPPPPKPGDDDPTVTHQCVVWMGDPVSGETSFSEGIDDEGDDDSNLQLTGQSIETHNTFRIGKLIAHGGESEVYEGQCDQTNRKVAIKVLHGRMKASEYDEAQIMARVEHPNIVSVFHVGDHDGLAYIIMEYVKETFQSWLNKHPKDWRGIISIGKGVARGLAVVHSKGFLHLDLKPSNILVTADGSPKLSDFGMANWLLEHRDVVSGTVPYMPPEQSSAGLLDPRTDLYALGAVLYKATTGHPPFEANSLQDSLNKSRSGEFNRTRPIDVPPPFWEIILKAMSKSPSDRYQTAKQFEDALTETNMLF